MSKLTMGELVPTDLTTIASNEKIAKIKESFLGYEDHGILTIYLRVEYGDGSSQSIGGYQLDFRCGTWVKGILGATGVDQWEKVRGRTVVVIRDHDGWNAKPMGLRPLPTENGKLFWFADVEYDA